MPSIRLGPKELLEYNATYAVLICRECQYAIQKSALQSHLLRHKIFRNERRTLLASIAQLNILEPDDVPQPPPSSNPIKALPVVAGFRCTLEGCDSLCASSKRMRRHQIEFHMMFESNETFSAVRPVSLQTFFRGTKIRYFEVATPTREKTAQHAPIVVSQLEEIEVDGSWHKGQTDVDGTDATMAATPIQSKTCSHLCNMDLEILTYFHHFTSVTSYTLPEPEYQQNKVKYWQTEFVAIALQQHWLTAGLLALSAAHMAALADDRPTSVAHCNRSVQWNLEYAKGRKTRTPGMTTPPEGVLDQIGGVLFCARIPITNMSDPSITLQSVLYSIRSLVIAGSTLRPTDIEQSGDHSQRSAFGQGVHLLETTDRSSALQMQLGRLDTLPARMADALGRPEDIRDVLTALSAIITLIDSCVAGFEIDAAAFWAMVTWLSKASEEFHHMLSQDDPAALIVLAHWAGSLVRRVEDLGCWFLQGATGFILTQVRERLEEHGTPVLKLIEGV